MAAPLMDHGARFLDFCSALFLPPAALAPSAEAVAADPPAPAPSAGRAAAAVAAALPAEGGAIPEFAGFRSAPGMRPGRGWDFPVRDADGSGAGGGGAGAGSAAPFAFAGAGAGAFGAAAFASFAGWGGAMGGDAGIPRPSNFAVPGRTTGRAAGADGTDAGTSAAAGSDAAAGAGALGDAAGASGGGGNGAAPAPILVAALDPSGAEDGAPPLWASQPADAPAPVRSVAAAADQVPEPGSLALLGLGLAVLAGVAVRRARDRRSA